MTGIEQQYVGLLIIQSTPFCNINCRYCYLPDRNSHHLATEEVLEATFRTVFSSGKIGPRITVVWHAGEPLVAPISFYERALEIAEENKPAGTEIKHCIQTNGMLIDEAWCAFFARSGISVGVSIDGPKVFHDANRLTRAGAGTFDTVMRAIRLLQDHGIGFNVISVIGKDALYFPDELFAFYEETGITNVALNIEEIEGANVRTSLDGPDTDRLFRQFIRRIFELYLKSDVVTSLREYDDVVMRAVAGTTKTFSNTQSTPFSIITVDHAGNFCTFSPELLGMKDDRYGDFVIGNFLRDDLDTAANCEKFNRLKAEIDAGIDACRQSCEYFEMCGGGAPSNKLYENGSFATSETMYCRLTKKAVTDEALQVYTDMLSGLPEEGGAGELGSRELSEILGAV